jgi:hypothetical protein
VRVSPIPGPEWAPISPAPNSATAPPEIAPVVARNSRRVTPFPAIVSPQQFLLCRRILSRYLANEKRASRRISLEVLISSEAFPLSLHPLALCASVLLSLGLGWIETARGTPAPSFWKQIEKLLEQRAPIIVGRAKHRG